MARYLCPPLIALVLLLSGGSEAAAPAGASQAAGMISGDVNCDGAVNSIDSLQILRDSAGLPVSADCLQQSGDVNCEATINSVDALGILRYVASLPVNTRAGCVAIGQELPGGARGQARQLAQEVIGAETDEARYEALLRVMEPLGIGVYTADTGEPVLLGEERAAGDFYLYDFELRLMATHIGQGDASTVDDLTTLLNETGVRENNQPLTAEALRTRLLNGVSGAFQDPEDPLSLLALLVRELGVRQPATYDMLQDVPLEDLKLSPLQYFLIFADITVPTVAQYGPVSPSASNLVAESGGVLKSIAAEPGFCEKWGKVLKHLWPLGVFAVGLSLLGPGAIMAAVIIDAIHGMMLAFSIQVASPDEYFPLITHYGHETPGKELRFHVHVIMRDNLGDLVTKCGWLLGVEFPPKGGVEGVEMRWEYAELPSHGDITCDVKTCQETDVNGVATLVFQPKNEQPPYGQGELQIYGTDVDGTAYYLSKFGNMLGRVNESLHPKKAYAHFIVDWHGCAATGAAPAGGAAPLAASGGADPSEGLPCAYEGHASATHDVLGLGVVTYTTTASDLRFELQSPDPAHPGGATYKLVQGTVTEQVTGAAGDCTISGGYTIPAPMDDGVHIFGGSIAVDPQNNKYAAAGGVGDYEKHVFINCPDQPPIWLGTVGHLWVLTTNVPPLVPDRSFTPGDPLQGSFDTAGNPPGWTSHYEWSFEPILCDPSPQPVCQ